MESSLQKLISCEIGPNYHHSDAWKAFQSLITTNPQARQFCQDWFLNYLGQTSPSHSDSITFADSGRTALYLLLKSLDLPKDSEILIQGFSCVVLPNSVWQSGLKPVLCDVDPGTFNFDLETIESKITPNTKVWILQYSFGIVPDMNRVLEICRKYKLILIEDCAHSLGATAQIDGVNRNVGTIGQASFFSFGRDKIVSSTVGGLAAINTRNFENNFEEQKENPAIQTWKKRFWEEHSQLPTMSGKSVIQALVYPILTTWFIRPLYHLQLGKLVLIAVRKLSLIGEIYTPEEKSGTSKPQNPSKFSPRLYSLLKNQLEQLTELNNHRRTLAKIYSEKLNLPFDLGSVYMRFPFTVSNPKIYQKIKTALRSRGVLIGTWYTSLFMQPEMDLETQFNYQVGDLPAAEKLSNQTTLNFPTNRYVTEKDAQMMAEFVAEVLKN